MNQNKPNILIFMTDQQQAQVIEHGHPCHLPNIRRLMDDGVTFSHAYTPMTHCCPARASFMTGMMPSKHGVQNNVCNDSAFTRGLNPGCEQFSTKLKDEGYDLAYTGKWHVTAEQDPVDFGWEELVVFSKGTYAHPDYVNYLNMQQEDDSPREWAELIQPGFHRYKFWGTHPDKEESIDQQCVNSGIEKLKKFVTSDDPWCLYIGTGKPHGPYIVPERYRKLYNADEIKLPPNYMDDMTTRPQLYQRMQKKYGQFSEAEVRDSIAHYWASCTMIDDLLGDALKVLDNSDQKENTLVIFCSDHGDFCGAHGLYAKGLPAFEEGYRIPYVMRWPAGIKNPGRREDAFITHCDISPTLTELAGAEPTADPSGKSLVPFLNDTPPTSWPDAFYSQCNGVEIYYSQRIVRTHSYKLVYNPSAVDELYDMKNDPYEMKNLIDDPDMQSVIRELFGKLWKKAVIERDIIMSSYHTISHADYGPAFAIGKEN